ncbi:MAG: hypothetical protein R2710_27365 [Acidimicrobiales bacterium]
MTLAAALSAAILVYLVVGLLVGVRPEWESRRVSAPSRLSVWRRGSNRRMLISPVGHWASWS